MARDRRKGGPLLTVWLFSRNDAIANAAVIVAAALVWLTSTSCPDLLIATLIAGLFIHSAWEILNDARRDCAREAAGRMSR